MSKKVTISDIAQLSQTSKTTVSFYLNHKYEKMSEETRNRIAAVIDETGYKPSTLARSMNSKKTNLIGVLIGDITNTFANQIVKGIETVTKEKGYQVIIGNSNYESQNEDHYIENMLNLGVDGFIIQPTSNFRKYSRIIKEKEKHMVFFDSQLYEHRTNWVKTNNYDAVYDMIQGAIDRGYSDFVMITADPSLLSTRIERASGFIDALSDNQLDYQKLIIDQKDSDHEKIESFLESAVNRSRKTLVFVPNCWALHMVFSVMKKLAFEMPQIGLVGFDNLEWTNFSSPTVTTIVQPAYEEGREAAEILINEIEGATHDEKQKTFDCDIEWKESTL
ncbi:LacI family DNA-binding transcriptional regulator [Streptococcus uberis]|uniref:LacI family DNA-binding transcriptional regulator n=1 Tax=Streptococcus uberis TaxID=1349 RepID=UPI0005442B97|nr:LacI family DNA-binding transcriptional regulator [Streptococcus uberis]KHD39757.1 transcriptional regulator [Streptococcus hongkongensis]KKF54417.1 transcriptional regulator [Streptococcus uberis B190]MCK1191084.1 LacI family DNA-binding transcriptional regulator [Streptococcus uberis]MCK1222239.1 LacI family DNA-binding transcriptional regulator [Streptococcus uberis]MEE3738948.1 LacI family DNA-binding transcriptional regulator [Streptococcus uberis]